MLRFYFPFVGLLVASTAVQAQHPLQFGVKAGLNASTYQGKELPDPAYRFGPSAGLFARWALRAHLSLQSELAVEQRGGDIRQQGSYGPPASGGRFTRAVKSRLSYVTVPVLARGQWGKMLLMAGPQVSYLVGARQRATELVESPFLSTMPRPITSTQTGARSYTRWDVGYVVGVGYALTTHVEVDVRYAAGLRDVGIPGLEGVGYDSFYVPRLHPTLRNRSVQAQVSYTFGT